MPESFTIPFALCRDSSTEALQAEIQSRTGSDASTRSILRSIERFGRDETIRFYEMLPQQQARTRHQARHASWTVRAVR